MSERGNSQSDDDSDEGHNPNLRIQNIQRLLEELRRDIDRFQEPFQVNNDASDALYWSANAGDLLKCQTLLAMEADVSHNMNSEYNQTPLHTASLNGRTQIVKLLIENRALVNCADKIGFTPLHAAAQEGHLDIARLLVNSGARTDATSIDGAMPIHSAVQNNRHQILTYLVTEAGVSVNVVSKATTISQYLIE